MNIKDLLLAVGISVISSLGTVGIFTALQKEVRAQKFVMVDKDGMDRAFLGMVDATPNLVLYDKNSRARVDLAVLPDGSAGLDLSDNDGKTRVLLSTLPDGSAGLALLNKNGKTRAMLGTTSLETTQLVLFDKEGKVLWRAP